MGAGDCPAGDFILDLGVLALRERLVDREVSVRKGVHIVINKLLVAINSVGSRGIGVVVNVVGGDKIVDSAKFLRFQTSSKIRRESSAFRVVI